MKAITRIGIRGSHAQVLSMASVLGWTFWIRAKTLDQAARGHADRWALYVGLWAPTFWLVGDALTRNAG